MHDKFGHSERLTEIRKNPELLREWVKFRTNFLNEEWVELNEAVAEDDWDGYIDAIIDWMVVAIGTLDGLHVDTQKAWDAVQDANMAKEYGTNPKRPNSFNLPDLIKPTGWIAPSHTDNLGALETLKVED